MLAALPFIWRGLDLGGLKGPPEMQQPFFPHMEPHRAQVDTAEMRRKIKPMTYLSLGTQPRLRSSSTMRLLSYWAKWSLLLSVSSFK